MTAEIFVDFLKEYIIQQKIDLKLEPPQTSTYIAGEERILIDYPHLCLADVPMEMWSSLIKTMLKEKELATGFIFWCVVEDQTTNRDNVLFLIYDRDEDILESYTADIFLSNYKPACLEECLPLLVDDYSKEIIYH